MADDDENFEWINETVEVVDSDDDSIVIKKIIRKKVPKQNAEGAQPITETAPVKKEPRMAAGAQDDDDEENMFQKPTQMGGGKDSVLGGGQISSNAKPFNPNAKTFDNAYKQDNVEAYVPRGPAVKLNCKDTAFAFVGTEVLYLDFEKNTWDTGDVTTFDINQPLHFPDNAGIVKVDSSQCTHSDIIVTGGADRAGAILNWVFGVQFQQESKNLIASMSCSDQGMLLPKGRFMHQSCVVKNGAGEPVLLVFGGKEGNTLQGDYKFSNSTLGIDLKSVYATGSGSTGWKDLAPMNSARANFAHLVLDNMVYAFGGISGKGTGEAKHHPSVASTIAEKYDPVADAWSAIEVAGALPLAAFGWSQITPQEILLFGGSDGDMLSENTWTIDFKELKSNLVPAESDAQLAMSNLCYREGQKTVYSFGGYNSGGINFQLNLAAPGEGWKEYPRNHTALTAPHHDVELVRSSFVYFS